MNTVKIEWVENKSADWKVATVTDKKHGKVENVSINRVNKKGETFPNFDGITPAATIAGDLWQSPAGKWYLFEAKTQGFSNSGKGNQMTKVMEKKNENIKESQENKAQGIKVSSTIRMAVDIVIARGAIGGVGTTKDEIQQWREWLWNEWDKEDKDFPPFN